MISDLQGSVESIQRRLRTSGAEPNVAERRGVELAEIGAAATAQIEKEFDDLTSSSEPSAA